MRRPLATEPSKRASRPSILTSGTVVVEAVVDPAGKVIEVKAVSGSKVLSYAAEEAVRKWTFVPAPEKSTETVDIKFALAE